MKKTKTIDKKLFWLIAILAIAGLGILASASFSVGLRSYGDPLYFIKRQLLLGFGVGIILFYAGLKIPIEFYKRYAPYILIGSIFLIVLVLISPYGTKVGFAHRWLAFGPIRFQPSEILKLAYIFYLASWMQSKRKEVKGFTSGFVPFIVITLISGIFLVAEPDIGTLGVLAFTALPLYYIGGGPGKHIALALILGLLVLGILIQLAPYRVERLTAFLHPEEDRQGKAYHINQAFIAISSGKIFGKGIGFSDQKFLFLPEPQGDAIFAVLAEETGLIGVLIILALFYGFLVRGMMIAAQAKNYFAGLVAAGITLLVAMQVAINIAAISGIFPLTGIPLPFISYGGSALAILLFEMGILLNISRTTS